MGEMKKTMKVSEATHQALFDRKPNSGVTYDELIREMMEETDGASPSDYEDTAQEC